MSAAAPDDRELMRRLRAGDPHALALLADRHAPPAFALAHRLLGDAGWAEEVVQDALLRLWQRPEMYDPSRGALRPWLLAVVHHRAVDELRGRRGSSRRAETPMPDLFDAIDSSAPPEEAALAADEARAVRRALAGLSQPQRQALLLAYFGGLSQRDVAAHLGEPLGTIKTRMRAGLQRLRALLADPASRVEP